jgi:uncharacterized membrane protein YhaH (DUF805 family)
MSRCGQGAGIDRLPGREWGNKMGISEAVSTCFSKYVTFQGRAARSEYWWWTLFVIIGYLIIFGVGIGLASMSDSGVPMFLPLVFMVAILLPSLAVLVRRLHDTDHSGWWFFIELVPIIGPLWLLYLLVISGTPGPNRFGT